MKKVISGIQPTNKLTLGNYLGAIKNFIDYSNDFQLLIFVADLHALSSDNNSLEIYKNTIDVVKIYLACGLNSKNVIIFRQSDIPSHTELFNILLNNTTIGELNRMTQFKDKSQKCKKENGTEFIPTSLLTYPVLMASDILLYDADLVIVGKDQKQHLELTRNLAKRLNNKYNKEIFTIPDIFINKCGSKILDLQNPEKKMSKSSENHKGVIFLSDDEKTIRKKISSALTDNFNNVKYDVENQPGISNLIEIYSTITNKPISDVESEFNNIENYGKFKSAVADQVCSLINDIQAKASKINDKNVIDILDSNGRKMNTIASNKIKSIYSIIGVRNEK